MASEKCGARAVFWPDDEACEAECWLHWGHSGPHDDLILGPWTDPDDG